MLEKREILWARASVVIFHGVLFLDIWHDCPFSYFFFSLMYGELHNHFALYFAWKSLKEVFRGGSS